MRQFLRETWELWYWALFRPSLLQARMNAWAPRAERNGKRADTTYILLSHPPRFLAQFGLLVLLLCIPLIVRVTTTGEARDWLFVLAAGASAFGLAIFFLPAGLLVPLLYIIVYTYRIDIVRKSLELTPIPVLPQQGITFGASIFIVGSAFVVLNAYWLGKVKWVVLQRIVLIIGGLGSLSVGVWLITQSWLATILVGVNYLLYGFSSGIANFKREMRESITINVIASAFSSILFSMFIIAGIFAFTQAFSMSGVIVGVLVFLLTVLVEVFGFFIVAMFCAIPGLILITTLKNINETIDKALELAYQANLILIFGMIFGNIDETIARGLELASAVVSFVVGILSLPLPLLLIVTWLTGFYLAPLRWRSSRLLFGEVFIAPLRGRLSGLVLGGVFIALSFQQQGLWALAVGATALVGFYRLLPLYPPLALLCISNSVQLLGLSLTPALPLLRWLPPFGDEVLWFALPMHDHVLAAAFRENPKIALAVLKEMRLLPYPGYQDIIQRALPQIVVDQLCEWVNGSKKARHIIDILVPELTQGDLDKQSNPYLNKNDKKYEMSIILPRLILIARDFGYARKIENPALVERGMEHCLSNLHKLQRQLIASGFNSKQNLRWNPVFVAWEGVLQQAIAHQRTLSQGEEGNPFQTGNPLRPERSALFKGRTQFVSDVLRHVYDASRPTLVLHGPRRCGKSSFLLNLPRLLPSDVLPVYYSLQAPAATASSGDFCYGMVRAMRRDMAGQGIVTPEPTRADFQHSPYASLEDWLLKMTEQLGPQRSVLLCFDEFEKLGEAVAHGRVDMAVFDQLRELIQHSSMSFLFCGVQTLAELGPNWSSYFISVQPMEMTYLEPDEAHALLTNPDPDFALRYAEGVVAQVVAITHCQPYLLQLIGEQIVRQANRHQTRLLTAPMLADALDAALTAGEPYFTNLWTEYTGTTPDEVRAGQAQLYTVAHGQPLPPADTPAARAALRRLVRYHVIEQADGGYRCEVPLVARWVRERAVLEEG